MDTQCDILIKNHAKKAQKKITCTKPDYTISKNTRVICKNQFDKEEKA